MKKILLVCVMLLAGCGGSSFKTSGFDLEDDGGPSTDAGVFLSSGGSPALATGTGGATAALETGGAPATIGTGGTPAAKHICCHFDAPTTETLSCSDADGGAVWWCAGGQTYFCTQPELCKIGMVCYLPGGPAGGKVEACDN